MIVYLHGFISSPQSHKATLLRDYLNQRDAAPVAVPQIPPYPADAARAADDFSPSARQRLCLVGSSLGGYYALGIWLNASDCRAVLVNPAIRPLRTVAKKCGRAGQSKIVHRYDVHPRPPAHTQQLRELEVPSISRPQRYWLLTQTGDEVLDAATESPSSPAPARR